jgi:acyl-coenzyme A synthetase/AMP-(fatty) acid ligase/thioesterase domain-containing protein/acyl carrier protein
LRERAIENPNQLISSYREETYTAGQLNADADALAFALLERLGPGDHRVAYVGNDIAVGLTSQLAIDRAGMVAVSVNRDEVPERLLAIMEAANCSVLIVRDDSQCSYVMERISFRGHPTRESSPSDVVFPQISDIVFTSGSTGTPKGALWPRYCYELLQEELNDRLDHIVGRTLNAVAAQDIYALRRALLRTPVHFFDVPTYGLPALPQWIHDKGITRLDTVPTVARLFAETRPDSALLANLEAIRLGGEPFGWADVDNLRPLLSPSISFLQDYGSTDVGPVGGARVNPTDVGSGPITLTTYYQGITVHICDDDGNELPAGALGELVIASPYSPISYLNDPERSAETYQALDDRRVRVRTGDVALIRPDGSLELRGRKDHVIKISGNRVELGEVENAMRSLPNVAMAAAAPYTDASGAVRLVGYVTAAQGTALEASAIRSLLQRRLPSYMVPDAVMVLSEMPLLAGGKLNRKSVPAYDPGLRTIERSDDALVDTVCAVMAEALGISGIGPNEDFFDLGGDSIRAARFIMGLLKRTGFDVPLSTLYEASQPATFVALMRNDDDLHNVLVPFRAEGSQPPLVVIHGGKGRVVWARQLLDVLDPDVPLLGIQAPEIQMMGLESPGSSIQEVASRYITALRAYQPTGPYRLYGYSYGAFVAFEMALQLQAAGHEVSFLGVGDVSLRLRRKGIKGLYPWYRTPKTVVNDVRRQWRERSKWQPILADLKRGVPVPQEVRGDYFRRAIQAIPRYRCRGVFRGDVLFFEADQASERTPPYSFVSGTFTVVPIHGRHRDLVKTDQLHVIGRAIQAALHASQRVLPSECDSLATLPWL